MSTLYKKPFLFLVAAILALAQCKYAGDDDLRLSRDFLDYYYVEADQKKALEISTGRAAEQIKKELELVQGMADREMSYKVRDVVFKLDKEEKTDGEVSYFYDLRIIQPNGPEMKKRVLIVVDRKAGKIRDFRTIE